MGCSCMDYLWIIVMFLSAVWTLILTAPIHCRGHKGVIQVINYFTFFQICSHEEKLIYNFDGMKVRSKKVLQTVLFWTLEQLKC